MVSVFLSWLAMTVHDLLESSLIGLPRTGATGSGAALPSIRSMLATPRLPLEAEIVTVSWFSWPSTLQPLHVLTRLLEVFPDAEDVAVRVLGQSRLRVTRANWRIESPPASWTLPRSITSTTALAGSTASTHSVVR
jgi:hypothetical protein